MALEVVGSKAPAQGLDWLGFQEYLSKTYCSKNTAKVTLLYAKKFYHVLVQNDAQDLLTIEGVEKRMNVMKSITVLSKYLGCFDMWQEMRRRYSLKWSNGDWNKPFDRLFNDNLNYDAMLQRVKEMTKVLQPHYGNIIKFDCLTGLRPAEAVESVRLINDKEAFAKYYKPERMALEHFRFSSVFLRRTKKAYISFVSPEILKIANSISAASSYNKILSYNAVRLAIRKRGINCDMRFCRKIHASWLSHCGIQSEIINMLQGRIPRSVFSRHYLTPKLDYRDKVLQAFG
jgi:hypothetical protein